MSEKPIIFEGNEVCIAHLAPTKLRCPCPEFNRDLIIEVDFRNHCYTEKFDPLLHDRKQIILYDSPERPRVFCPVRYGLSHELPKIVEEMLGRKVFQTTQVRNYVYVVTLQISNRYYEVYFMIQRAERDPVFDLRVTVESAYSVPTPPHFRAGQRESNLKRLHAGY